MPSENTIAILEHKRLVALYMQSIVSELFQRAVEHDYSKFSLAEFETFEVATPKLKTLTYGSNEYNQALADIQPALRHHYAENSHHPEHYSHGINGMTLTDLIEMVCDWLAAVQNSPNGNIYKSLPINVKRFGIDDQLAKILYNTMSEFQPESTLDKNTLYPDVLLAGKR